MNFSKISLSNKIAIITLIVTIIGIIISSNFKPQDEISQSSKGNSSPIVNTKGNVVVDIK